MESNDGPVRISIIVDRLPGPNDLVRQRHEVPDGRRRSDILEVRSIFRRQTPLPEFFQLGIRLRHTGIELLQFFGVPEVGRDGLIDGPHDGIIPKRKLFRIGAEANYVAGAGSCRGVGIGGGRQHKRSDVSDQTDRAEVIHAASSRLGSLSAWGFRRVMGRKVSQ